MDIVLLGAPGAGKGTQATLLRMWLPWPQVSTGVLFRAAMADGSELGDRVRGYVERGELVPDEVTLAVVRARLAEADCAAGVILDGFPRTLAQAQGLDVLLAETDRALGLVADVNVSEAVLMARLAGRWQCSQCGAVYHALLNPEVKSGKCKACGGGLYQREDDAPAVQARRIQVYQAQTAPLKDYYRERGLLAQIDGEPAPVLVQRALRKAILERMAGAAGSEAFERAIDAGLA